MNEQDKNLLASLIEEHKHIWEDEVDNHIYVDVYEGDSFRWRNLCTISGSAIYHFDGEGVAALIPDIIAEKLYEAGVPVIKVQLDTIRKSNQTPGHDWLKEAVAEYEKNQQDRE